MILNESLPIFIYGSEEDGKKEIWKDIPGYEGYYQASNLGRIKSVERDVTDSLGRTRHYEETILSLSHDKYGYETVGITRNGKSKLMKVHRLVAMTFLPNPDNLSQVNHKNEIRYDNRVENLEWCDASYNNNYGNRTKNSNISKKERGSYHCGKDVICNNITYESISDCAKAYSVNRTTLYNWLNGEAHMPIEFQKMGLRFETESKIPTCKKKQRKKKIVCESVLFNSITNCANYYGVNRSSMSYWLNGKYTMPQKFQDLGLRYA